MGLRRMMCLTGMLTLIGVGAACSPGQPAALVVALPDTSGSTKSAALRAAYDDALSAVVSVLQGGDRFVIGKITGSSATEVRFPVDVTLPTYSFLGGDDRKAVEQARATVASTIEEGLQGLLMASKPGGSCIIDAIGIAGRLFASVDPNAPKSLVVLSDMYEKCGSMSFYRTQGHAPAAVVRTLKADGRVPNLTGVDVYVVGALRDRATPQRNDRFVREFFFRFFEAAGANLTNERWGGPLIGYGRE